MSVLFRPEDDTPCCPQCDFTSASWRLVEIHYEAVHVSAFLATLPTAPRPLAKEGPQ